MWLRAGHRTTILFGRCLSALAAHLLDASADDREIISNAGSGHVSSCLSVCQTNSGRRGLVMFLPFFFIPDHAGSSPFLLQVSLFVESGHRMTRAVPSLLRKARISHENRSIGNEGHLWAKGKHKIIL
jgi:hypothetical protein